jgi:hypothetical protein
VTESEPIFDDLVDSHILPAWAHRISTQMNQLIVQNNRLIKEMADVSTDQDRLNSLSDEIKTAVAAVAVEIDALKAQVAAGGGNMDFSNADAALAALQAIEPNANPTPDPNPAPPAA